MMENQAGTAGGPILNILEKNNLCNILVIITRYFGGILLGTGGLVRAYSDATSKVIENATLVSETLGLEVEIEIEYNQLELFKYYCKNKNINIVDIVYENNIKCYVEVTNKELEQMIDNNTNNCNILNNTVIKTKNIRKKAK